MKKLLLLSFLVLIIGCEKDPIRYTLSVAPSPFEGGVVNPSTGIYNEGESATISAAPSQYYTFKNWSGSWAGSSPTIILVMDGDKRLNNIPSKIAKWPLLQSGEGNEMTLIANKLNEGWEIVQMNQTMQSVTTGGYSFGSFETGWIVHMKRKVKK